MTPASLQGLGAHGGHGIQSIGGDWASLGKEGGRFGTYGSKRREGKGKVLGVMKGVVWSWLAFKSAEVRGRVHSTS